MLEEYNKQQVELRAKQKMLKEDWERFKNQQRTTKKVIMKGKIVKILPQNKTGRFSLHNIFNNTSRIIHSIFIE